ncbi:MAG: peptidoglycan DD-metalloendopeptidase family protein [Pseudomonadales bacterium]|nr:peptidoglycan DD-metalloendopeptidase family protein [Pseudomonadales bacterium]
MGDISSQPPPRTHRVNGGETLYAVAWMYDLDYNTLARLNNISAPYTIFPGQTLIVDNGIIGSGGNTATTLSASAPAANRQGQAVSSAVVLAPPVSRRDIDAPVSTESPAASVAVPDAAKPGVVSNGERAELVWAWPARGPLLGRFSASGVENKGIDIGGREGDDVLAAAAGEVVYAGRGLLRYGELVIVKHNEHFLSAYAHNRQILVTEGERVALGQQIAELGSTGIDHDMLHFEIRLDGKPVNPLSYLPSR